MQAKNPRYNRNNTIDLDINHPVYGWIPFTASPDDVEQYGKDLYNQARTGKFGTIAPYVKLAVVIEYPDTITMRQMRLNLLQLELLDDVEAAINSETNVTLQKTLKIEWEYSSSVSRNGVLANLLKTNLNFDDQKLNDFFLSASKL